MHAKFRAARAAASCVALFAALASGAALAQVDVSNAWARGTVPAQTASGAFMTLHAHEAASWWACPRPSRPAWSCTR